MITIIFIDPKICCKYINFISIIQAYILYHVHLLTIISLYNRTTIHTNMCIYSIIVEPKKNYHYFYKLELVAPIKTIMSLSQEPP